MDDGGAGAREGFASVDPAEEDGDDCCRRASSALKLAISSLNSASACSSRVIGAFAGGCGAALELGGDGWDFESSF